jgi:hypothetical protein
MSGMGGMGFMQRSQLSWVPWVQELSWQAGRWILLVTFMILHDSILAKT